AVRLHARRAGFLRATRPPQRAEPLSVLSSRSEGRPRARRWLRALPRRCPRDVPVGLFSMRSRDGGPLPSHVRQAGLLRRLLRRARRRPLGRRGSVGSLLGVTPAVEVAERANLRELGARATITPIAGPAGRRGCRGA